MSQDAEKYLHFTVGLLKDSFALNALWQDAMRYHMIDQPGKLIALRLTEYYEAIERGSLPASATAPAPPLPSTNSRGNNSAARPVDHNDQYDGLIGTSPTVSENAEAAADYWAPLP